MGRTGHPALILGVAAILVAAAGAGVAISRGEGPIAKAPTSLAAVHDAVVVGANGVTSAARDGQRVPDGAVVRTGPAGSVELVTRGRAVYVGHSAAVAVINGAHQQLRTGTAVYDAQHGDGLRVDIAGDRLTVPSGSAVEAQRSVSVQVGALAGPAQITSAAAREVTVRPLTQAVLNGDALAASTAPLHLSDSADEARAVPALVDADRRLKALARGIDASGNAEAAVITAAWSGPTATMPAATPRSERVLPIVMADATSPAATTAAQRYQSIVAWRRAGGSWGVTLAYLSGSIGHVESTLTSLQHGQPAGQIGRVSVLAAGAVPNAPTHHHATRPHHSSPPPPPPSHPSHPTSPSPTPTPTPTKNPVKKVLTGVGNTVGDVVQTVVGLLPVKKILSPNPTSSSSGGLIGGLLGH